MKLDRDDSEDVGFVEACLFYQAISKEELRLWADYVLGEVEDFPDYIIELSTFHDELFKIDKVIGFTPHWPFSEKSKRALWGIAASRGTALVDCPLSREEALSLRSKFPEVVSRFRELFPFIDLPPCE